ncbi:hypothetical protein Taro_006065, partial [Colocasia esculenta]|nr:hypothetical protein [Colocasia esculenta]
MFTRFTSAAPPFPSTPTISPLPPRPPCPFCSIAAGDAVACRRRACLPETLPPAADAATSHRNRRSADALGFLGESWNNKPPSWTGSDPCGSQWDGISCTGSRITSITLSSTGLQGELSGDIGSLTELETLMTQMTTHSLQSDDAAPISAEDAFIAVMGRDRPGRVRCVEKAEMLRTWYGRGEGLSSAGGCHTQ